MNLGDTPDEIIQWLIDNDVSNQPEKRQYGIVALINDSSQTAAHTGDGTDDYKGHIIGPDYSIQGNILSGQAILESMEYNFLNAEGDLACRLMAALQGANVAGADSRCLSNGTSSLFAFLKVAQPDDTFGNPSFLVSVRTASGDGIEPIDSLQSLFEEVKICSYLGIDERFNSQFIIYPNPVREIINIKSMVSGSYKVNLLDITARNIYCNTSQDHLQIDMTLLSKGVYFVCISNEYESLVTKIIKQ